MTATFATFVPDTRPGSTLASRPLGEATARGGGHPSPATSPRTVDRRHAVRRINATPDVCPHCDGRVTEGHYRDTGAATVMPIDVCPVLFAKRARGN